MNRAASYIESHVLLRLDMINSPSEMQLFLSSRAYPRQNFVSFPLLMKDYISTLESSIYT